MPTQVGLEVAKFFKDWGKEREGEEREVEERGGGGRGKENIVRKKKSRGIMKERIGKEREQRESHEVRNDAEKINKNREENIYKDENLN